MVPNPLLTHWEEQIVAHINFKYFSTQEQNIIYCHTKNRNFKARSPIISSDLQQTLIQRPLVFIDDGTKELPPASVLARFPIVLTAYNRFTAEWKLGSLEKELKTSRKGVYWGDDKDDTEASPLLKVHWVCENVI